MRPLDHTTEEAIKQAARKIFVHKGFTQATNRDIAGEAGVTMAMLNYYFRSKDNLFDIVVTENIERFMQILSGVFNEENTSLTEKIELLVERYIETLIDFPEMPLFLLTNADRKANLMAGKLEALKGSVFIRQFSDAVKAGKVSAVNPVHFLYNICGLVIYPFIANPLMQKMGAVDRAGFIKLMEERKALLPVWINSIIKSS